MPSDNLIETEDARSTGPVPSGGGEERRYLLVLDGDTSWHVPLPRQGHLLIGRSTSADIAVSDPAVSRQHARISMMDGEACVTDLESHNGVRVNGVRVASSQVLQSGNVVTLGDVTIVFHCGNRSVPARPVLDAVELRGRLAEELDRVRSYGHAVSVFALELGSASVPFAELVRAASEGLRLMDLIGQVGASLMAILPELEGEEAEAAAQHLLELLAPKVPQARAGLVTAPQDGLNAEALMAAAHAAALKASPGSLQVSGPGLHWLALGERSVLVADPQMVATYEKLRRLAASSLTVLIHGETGSGKEHAAWAVHYWSRRAAGPFVALNCAALNEGVVESELFGHERGAFSGADKSRVGFLERAHGGTLFMDEVAELSLTIQAKLLRALECKRITRLGDSHEREVDFRVVAATHRNLKERVEAGAFREDLYHRLSDARVELPPLRDRPQELPLLASAFLVEGCAQEGRAVAPYLSAAAMEVLSAYPWPGNVRELQKTMRYVAAMANGPIVEPSHVLDHLNRALKPTPAAHSEAALAQAPAAPPQPPEAAPPDTPARRTFRPLAEELRELEQQRMREALEAAEGVQTRAAQLIGMPLRTFAFKLKRYKLAGPQSAAAARTSGGKNPPPETARWSPR